MKFGAGGGGQWIFVQLFGNVIAFDIGTVCLCLCYTVTPTFATWFTEAIKFLLSVSSCTGFWKVFTQSSLVPPPLLNSQLRDTMSPLLVTLPLMKVDSLTHPSCHWSRPNTCFISPTLETPLVYSEGVNGWVQRERLLSYLPLRASWGSSSLFSNARKHTSCSSSKVMQISLDPGVTWNFLTLWSQTSRIRDRICEKKTFSSEWMKVKSA